MLLKVWSGIFLLGCAIVDVKTNKVYQNICIINYLIALIAKVIFSKFHFQSLVISLCMCAILFLIAVLTKQAIGYGDVFVILTLTGILNVKSTVEIFFFALLVCCVFSIVILLTRKGSMKSTLPFVPFLLAGDFIWIVLGEFYV